MMQIQSVWTYAKKIQRHSYTKLYDNKLVIFVYEYDMMPFKYFYIQLYNWMTAMSAERLVGKWKLPGSNGCANSNADSASRSHCAGSVRRERLSAALAVFLCSVDAGSTLHCSWLLDGLLRNSAVESLVEKPNWPQATSRTFWFRQQTRPPE